MAVRIIDNADGAVLYCSTEMEAFGPVFDDVEAAEDFLDWLPDDARTIAAVELRLAYDRWHDATYDGDGHFVGRQTTASGPG